MSMYWNIMWKPSRMHFINEGFYSTSFVSNGTNTLKTKFFILIVLFLYFIFINIFCLYIYYLFRNNFDQKTQKF
jgi:uncharacterized membrane protein